MKILKLPFEMKVECSCGCIFEFDYEEIDIQCYQNLTLDGDRHFVRRLEIPCPICHKIHDLQDIRIEKENKKNG